MLKVLFVLLIILAIEAIIVTFIKVFIKGEDALYYLFPYLFFITFMLVSYFKDYREYIKSIGSTNFLFYKDRFLVDYHEKGTDRSHEFRYTAFIIPFHSITIGTPEQLASLLKEKLGERFSKKNNPRYPATLTFRLTALPPK